MREDGVTAESVFDGEGEVHLWVVGEVVGRAVREEKRREERRGDKRRGKTDIQEDQGRKARAGKLCERS